MLWVKLMSWFFLHYVKTCYLWGYLEERKMQYANRGQKLQSFAMIETIYCNIFYISQPSKGQTIQDWPSQYSLSLKYLYTHTSRQSTHFFQWIGLCSMPRRRLALCSGEWQALAFFCYCVQQVSSQTQFNPVGIKYSLVCFAPFCLVKRIVKYFPKEFSEWKVSITDVAGLYSTYQKYIMIGAPNYY